MQEGVLYSHPFCRVITTCLLVLIAFCLGCQDQATGNDQATRNSPEASIADSSEHNLSIPYPEVIPENPFAAIDAHARNCPEQFESDLSSLADYLGQLATTDLEKARSIYVWLTDNIHYDDDAFNTGQFGNYSSSSTLISKKAVCEGFGNLYQALGEELNLNIRKVEGYAKGFGYRPGTRSPR